MVGKAFRHRAAVLALALGGLRHGPALAQEADPKQAAKLHFDAGNGLLARGEVAAALAEFQQSRALFPTRGNTLNAAIALQRLGRFDEALELYGTLPRDFELDAEQRSRVEREIELLRGLTGTLVIRAEPGVSVSIDGRERGSAPFREPLIVLGGGHTVRARQPGRAGFERRIEIVTGSQQELVIDALAVEEPMPVPAPPAAAPSVPLAPPPALAAPPRSVPVPVASPAPSLSLALDFGPAFGLGFGGDLADSCGASCDRSLPLGFSPRARGGLRISHADFGIELGYSRLAGSYDGRSDTLEPRGSGKQLGSSDDHVTWSAWSLGGYAGLVGRGRLHVRALIAGGVTFARIRDEREGTFDVTPQVGDDYRARVSADQSTHAKAAYLAPELGLGYAASEHVELSLGLTLMSSIVLSPARFVREGVVVRNAMNEPELAYWSESELTGGLIFALLPRVGAVAHF